jgi:hypothetical protein
MRHKPTTPYHRRPVNDASLLQYLKAPVFDFLDFEDALAGVATAVADGPPVESGAAGV